MFYVISGVAILTLFILLNIVYNRNEKQKKLDKIRNSWSKVKDEYFNFTAIEIYFIINKEPFFYKLSPQTINDIDFYDLFCFIDRTTSRVGQQYLFDKLLKPSNDIESIEQLDKQANFFNRDKASRENVQKLLILLSGEDCYNITSLLQPKLFTKPVW